MNLAILINCSLYDIVFAVSSTPLLILLTIFIFETENILCFSVFSPGQLNSPSNSFTSFVMIK